MKIALANLQRDYGGAEIHVRLLATGLRARGHALQVWCHPEGRLGRESANAGLSTASFQVRGQLSPVAALRWAAQLQRNRPDVLHLHTPKEYWCGVLAARLARVPVVVLTRHMLLPLKPVMRRVYHRADAVVCLSQGIRALLLNEGLPSAHLPLLYGAINTVPFDVPQPVETVRELRAAWQAGTAALLVGCVARLTAGKGHATLLEAVARYGKQEPSLRLVLVGEGQEQAALQSYAHQLGIANRVVFAGFHNDIARVLAALDIVVVPSTRAELLPLALLEAMAASRAVIAADVGGVSEIVTSEAMGKRVPPGDANALAQALRELACGETARHQLGTRGAQVVRERFALPRLLDETEALYSRLLANRTQRSAR